jgi:hypothetical protein
MADGPVRADSNIDDDTARAFLLRAAADTDRIAQ